MRGKQAASGQRKNRGWHLSDRPLQRTVKTRGKYRLSGNNVRGQNRALATAGSQRASQRVVTSMGVRQAPPATGSASALSHCYAMLSTRLISLHQAAPLLTSLDVHPRLKLARLRSSVDGCALAALPERPDHICLPKTSERRRRTWWLRRERYKLVSQPETCLCERYYTYNSKTPTTTLPVADEHAPSPHKSAFRILSATAANPASQKTQVVDSATSMA